jgi:antitoxin HicB
MKATKKNPHIGSSVDEFFAEDGLLEEIEAIAIKRVIAMELQQALENTPMTKTELARRLETSRSQVDRILDPTNESITLSTLMKAAALLGKRLHISLQAAPA